MDNLENKNNKFLIRFGVLADVCKYLIGVCSIIGNEKLKSKKVTKSVEKMMIDIICSSTTQTVELFKNHTLNELKVVEGEIDKLKTIYQIGISPILNRPTSDPLRDLLFDEFIETENFHGWTKDIFKKLMIYGDMIKVNRDKNKEYIGKCKEIFDQQYIAPRVRRKDVRICTNCDIRMTVYPDLSELRCPNCAIIVQLEGTIFEDAMLFTQQVIKVKEYDPNKHCDKWIKCIQTKENKIIPPDVINKIDTLAVAHFTRKGKLMSMAGMTCLLVRAWLKKESTIKGAKLTTYNNHAALLRRMVTALHGNAVIPPQLTYDEEEKLLLDFSRAMNEYDKIITDPATIIRIGAKSRSNKPYYPYGLYKILRIRYRKAVLQKNRADQEKYKRLIECIHIQSDDTLVDNDIIWREICTRIPEFPYEATDRNFLYECM